MASLKKTYFQKNLKTRAIMLISCGHVAIATGIYSMFISHNQHPLGVADSPISTPFPSVQLGIAILLLSWPFIAGIVGIINLSREDAKQARENNHPPLKP